jgi:hypothetical protein
MFARSMMRGAAAALAVAGVAAVAVPSAGARPADFPAPATAAPPPHATTRVVEVHAGGFDWGDAGLGAAGTLSLIAVGAGAVAVTRRSRPRLS